MVVFLSKVVSRILKVILIKVVQAQTFPTKLEIVSSSVVDANEGDLEREVLVISEEFLVILKLLIMIDFSPSINCDSYQ